MSSEKDDVVFAEVSNENSEPAMPNDLDELACSTVAASTRTAPQPDEHSKDLDLASDNPILRKDEKAKLCAGADNSNGSPALGGATECLKLGEGAAKVSIQARVEQERNIDRASRQEPPRCDSLGIAEAHVLPELENQAVSVITSIAVPAGPVVPDCLVTHGARHDSADNLCISRRTEKAVFSPEDSMCEREASQSMSVDRRPSRPSSPHNQCCADSDQQKTHPQEGELETCPPDDGIHTKSRPVTSLPDPQNASNPCPSKLSADGIVADEAPTCHAEVPSSFVTEGNDDPSMVPVNQALANTPVLSAPESAGSGENAIPVPEFSIPRTTTTLITQDSSSSPQRSLPGLKAVAGTLANLPAREVGDVCGEDGKAYPKIEPDRDDHIHLPKSGSHTSSCSTSSTSGREDEGAPTDIKNSAASTAKLHEAISAHLENREGEELEAASAESMRTKNEVDDSAVRVERPSINLTAEHKLSDLGVIVGILDKAVVISTHSVAQTDQKCGTLTTVDVEDAAALDAGSILCFADRSILGEVYETFGPVRAPFYTVRFNSREEIDGLKLAKVGEKVFSVPQLCRTLKARDVESKGYDSSNLHDEELSGNLAEFSDDEAERAAKRARKRRPSREVREAPGEALPKRGRVTHADRRPIPPPGNVDELNRRRFSNQGGLAFVARRCLGAAPNTNAANFTMPPPWTGDNLPATSPERQAFLQQTAAAHGGFQWHGQWNPPSAPHQTTVGHMMQYSMERGAHALNETVSGSAPMNYGNAVAPLPHSYWSSAHAPRMHSQLRDYPATQGYPPYDPTPIFPTPESAAMLNGSGMSVESVVGQRQGHVHSERTHAFPYDSSGYHRPPQPPWYAQQRR